MRGDRPSLAFRRSVLVMFTPHARGSTYCRLLWLSRYSVYPACAGIDQEIKETQARQPGLPRMRGDRPLTHPLYHNTGTFTPHARGSTLTVTPAPTCLSVYPACAGIDRKMDLYHATAWSLPRMRGDRPWSGAGRVQLQKFTPHARGSTLNPNHVGYHNRVYPACAGIDPFSGYTSMTCRGLPRMRGDRPGPLNLFTHRRVFTPHARGSTLYPPIGCWQ